MAGNAQAQSFVNLGLTSIDQIAQVKDAAKAAEKELRAVDREIDKLFSKGKTVSDDLLRRRNMAEQMVKANNALFQNQKRMMDEQALTKRNAEDLQRMNAEMFRDERKMAGFFRKIAGAQFVRGLFGGDVDAQQAARFLLNRDTTEALEKAGFVRLAGAFQKALPAGLLAMFGIDQVIGAVKAREKDVQTTKNLGADIAAGKLPPALQEVFNREMEKFRFNSLQKSENAKVVVEGYRRLVGGFIQDSVTEKDMREAVNTALDELTKENKRGAYTTYDAFRVQETWKAFQEEKTKRENRASIFEEMSAEDQANLAAEMLARMEITDENIIAKFAEKLDKINRRNALAKQREARDREANKSPTELFDEMNNRHERRVWAGLRRFDVLAQIARSDKRTFVRD